jgi:hypothetical protein
MKIRDLTQGVAEGLNEFAPDGFNGGNDGDDLQLYLNVAKKLNMKKYKPSTAHALIAKKMAELVDAVDDDKVDYARHMARKAQGLPNMLEQGVAEGDSNAIANTASRLANKDDGKVAKLRAAGDKRREEQLRGRDIAKRDNTSKDAWGDLKVDEEKQRLDPKCWTGYKKDGTKIKGGVRVNNCVKEELEETYDGDEFFEAYGELWYNEDEQLDEAEYHGRNVQLGKPMQGDVKKFKVYVKDPGTGNIKKVNFGDPNMRIKKSNPARRRSFRARHNCDNPGPRTKARYWSCRKW